MFEFNIQTANVHNIPIVLTVQDMAEILRVSDIVVEELVRDGKIRGAKTHYILGNLIEDSDSLFQNLIFSHYQNIFSLPDKIFFNMFLN